jgi:serine/threonine-protein kinase
MIDRCNRERLVQSLEDRLDEREEEALASHLSECAACRTDLERLAGDPAVLSRICMALKEESTPDIDAPSMADFAVDFLGPSASPEAIGKLGEIDVLEVIGSGGMGVVLKGYQSELKRLVAVKVLSPHLAVSGPARQRFAREAQAAAAILHPNVMPILTVHSGGKLPYLVMPFLACESLHQRIARSGALELVDVLRIGVQTARGLAEAHAQGLVHRDVKPANILLEKGVERVMLTDFGLARAIDDASITRSGVIAGTPQYMSPEQVRGETLDGRSDLFSLGSVLYAMAAGRPPFRAETTYGILHRITSDAPRRIRDVNPAVPEWLASIIEKLHAKRPEDRFSSASEVAKLLEACLAHVQQPDAVPLPPECKTPPGDRRKRRRTIAWVAGLATAGLVGIAALAISAIDDGVSDRAPAAKPVASESDTEWDAIADDTQRLEQDTSLLETQAKRLWDSKPQITAEPLKSEHNQ